jgi:hypothetical protein
MGNMQWAMGNGQLEVGNKLVGLRLSEVRQQNLFCECVMVGRKLIVRPCSPEQFADGRAPSL